MVRDIDALLKAQLDILIVGTGIYGASIARLAAMSGYSTALVDMNDLCSATSANSLKIIHGGLRYLQHGNLKRIRQSIRSRKIMQQVAPNFTRNVPFVIPTYGEGIRSKAAMKIALAVNDLISIDRNRAIDEQCKIPQGYILNKTEMEKLVPGLTLNNLTGGAVWYECISNNTERLTLEFIKQAVNYGALVANYLKIIDVVSDDNTVKGVVVQNKLTSNKFEISCNAVVNTTGPWLDDLIDLSDEKLSKPLKLIKAVNIIVKRKLFANYAVGLESIQKFHDKDAIVDKGKRLFFFVPWREYTMIGTSYKTFDGLKDDCTIEKSDMEEIISEVNQIYPKAKLDLSDVSYYHIGLIPMDELQENKSNVQPDKHSKILHCNKLQGFNNFFSVKSVKFTTAPVMAEELMEIIKRSIPKNASKKTPAIERQSHSGVSVNEISHLIDTKTWKNIEDLYGNESSIVYRIIKENPELVEKIDDKGMLCEAEIVFFIREEMAVKLSDVVLRRTDVGTACFPGDKVLEKIAGIMAKELNWSCEKIQTEIKDTKSYYSLLLKDKRDEAIDSQ